MTEHVQTIIVGAGQAGLAAGYCLAQRGREALLLEQASRPGSAWQDQRWDSFTLVTPNWSVRLPGAEYQGSQPYGFMNRAELAAHFDAYAGRIRQPLRCGVSVRSVELEYGGYRVRAEGEEWIADNVIIATGFFQHSKIPAFAVGLPPEIVQIPAEKYRSPQALPPGAVLVVGTGQTGSQIADELYKAGRKVYLCVGSTGRLPRRYRGNDIFDWLIKIGFMSRTADTLPTYQARFMSTAHLTGKDGGRTLNLHQFYRDGVMLLGHLRGHEDGRLRLEADLMESLARTDELEANTLKQIDEYIAGSGLEAPEDSVPILRDGYSSPVMAEVNLKSAGITSVVWALGNTFDYSLVKLPVFDFAGFPITRHCAAHPGLYFIGMPWLTARKSGFLVGVGEDAAMIADQISSA